jgi:hypothetical protein
MPKVDWRTLTHDQRIGAMHLGIDNVLREYSLGDQELTRQELERFLALWRPGDIDDLQLSDGAAPRKDMILGAWRDLDRVEAILEFIDNSIDGWHRLRGRAPDLAPKDLRIVIELTEHGQLVYEDNAGGVPSDRLINLVVPGQSETDALSPTIGSYRTGGKKAVFRLATAANILTRYLSPAGNRAEDAYSVQLDEAWLRDLTDYRFHYARVKNAGLLEPGQTRYVIQLREEPIGGPPWYKDPEQLDRIRKQIETTYALLLIRNPHIKIFFRDRATPLKPDLEMFEFTGMHDANTDIRPQQVTFVDRMPFEGVSHNVSIEIAMGCRTTTAKGIAGIDLYGNNRLYARNQTLFDDYWPRGQASLLTRGFVNIVGPNIFIPWDTHKRHVNADGEIISRIKRDPLVNQLLTSWGTVYRALSKVKVSSVVGAPLVPLVRGTDLNFAHKETVELDSGQRRRKKNQAVPFFVPRVPAPTKSIDAIKVPLVLTSAEARKLSAHYGVLGDPASAKTARELGEFIKADILKRAKKKS